MATPIGNGWRELPWLHMRDPEAERRHAKLLIVPVERKPPPPPRTGRRPLPAGRADYGE